jgi:NADH-quinone oxidoreductase subunit N
MSFLDVFLIIPEIFFINYIVVFLWVGLYLRYKTTGNTLFFTFNSYAIFLILQVIILFTNAPVDSATVLNNIYVVGNFELFLKLFTLITSLLTLLLIRGTTVIYNLTKFGFDIELETIKLIIISSMLFLISVNDFLYLFFILELYALSAYVFVGYKGKFFVFSSEAALKYFILGTVFSIVMAYSIALIYLATGLTNFSSLDAYLTVGVQTAFYWNYYDLLFYSVLLLLVSFFFKLAVSPFHFWAPDVYDGAPTTTMFFLSVIPKIAILGVLVKLTFLWATPTITLVIVFSAILSVVVGSIGGIFQKRFKRLLTYSMVNNNGFFLLPLTVMGLYGYIFMFFFLIIYTFSLIGLFGSLMSLKLQSTLTGLKNLWSWTNLFFINKLHAILTAILFFSSAGLPPLVGFMSKFLILCTLVLNSSNLYYLLILVLIFAPLSCFYYIRIIKIMAFSKKRFWIFLQTPTLLTSYLLSLSVVLLIIFFICSGLLLNTLTLVLYV